MPITSAPCPCAANTPVATLSPVVADAGDPLPDEQPPPPRIPQWCSRLPRRTAAGSARLVSRSGPPLPPPLRAGIEPFRSPAHLGRAPAAPPEKFDGGCPIQSYVVA